MQLDSHREARLNAESDVLWRGLRECNAMFSASLALGCKLRFAL